MLQVQGTSLNTVLTLGLTTRRLHCPILHDEKIKTLTAQTTHLWKAYVQVRQNMWQNFVIMLSKHNKSLLLNANLSSPHPSLPNHISPGRNYISRGPTSQNEFSRTEAGLQNQRNRHSAIKPGQRYPATCILGKDGH